ELGASVPHRRLACKRENRRPFAHPSSTGSSSAFVLGVSGASCQKIAADAHVIMPTHTNDARNACSASCLAASVALKFDKSAAAAATPMLMASIWPTDRRPVPLLACCGPRSLSVTVFIVVNCSELTAPKEKNCKILSHTGCSAVMSANEAIIVPTSKVFVMSKLR